MEFFGHTNIVCEQLFTTVNSNCKYVYGCDYNHAKFIDVIQAVTAAKQGTLSTVKPYLR